MQSCPMATSGSEFALRIALCDLVERLKRTEDKCKHLEVCRNEMAREIVRLRAENQRLQSALSTSNYLDQDPAANQNGSFGNNERGVLLAHNHLAKPVNTADELSVLDEHNPDETWEEITVRLIKELKKEVANSQSPRGDQKTATPQPRTLWDLKNQVTKSSSKSNLLVKEKHSPPRSKPYGEPNLMMENNLDKSRSPDDIKDTHEASKEKEAVIDEDMVEHLAKALASDYQQLKAILTSQNERLSKLKAQQLRSFFNRHITCK